MRFRAEIEMAGTDGRWRIVYMPFSVAEVFGTRGQVKVKGTVNGFPFSSSLFPNGKGQHFMMINKAMQRGGRTGESGTAVEIELEPDRRRPIVVPPALKQSLAKDKAAQRCFDALPDSWKRAYITRVTAAKGKEAQARRSAIAAERLAELDRGLKDPPAIVKAMLARSLVARQQFAKLSASHKREYISYILDAASEDTRRRRAQKVLQKLLAAER
jgi:uncharacterized protein YdeI (YjbR/CyaY-like superfamily)